MSKDRLKTKQDITFHDGIGDLLTSVLFSVVNILSIDVLLGTALINKHLLAILPEEQNVTVWKSTPGYIVKQHDLSGDAVLANHNTQDANIKTHLETKKDQRSTIKRSNTV